MPSVTPPTLRRSAAAIFALMLATVPVATAQAQSNAPDPDVLLEEGTKKILRAFELFIMTIPQYEMPEVLPNGDIIIRRKNPPGGDRKEGPGVTEPPVAGAPCPAALVGGHVEKLEHRFLGQVAARQRGHGLQ